MELVLDPVWTRGRVTRRRHITANLGTETPRRPGTYGAASARRSYSRKAQVQQI